MRNLTQGQDWTRKYELGLGKERTPGLGFKEKTASIGLSFLAGSLQLPHPGEQVRRHLQ
jgi:hypothetical protein